MAKRRVVTVVKIQLPAGQNGLAILLAGLLSAVLWGTYTWWRGIPSSSTHALVGGLAGALANAVFNATGVRIRELPITPDKILMGLMNSGSISTAD